MKQNMNLYSHQDTGSSMFRYSKKKHQVKIFCPNCRQNIAFQIPDEIFDQEHAKYPFTFRHIHGHPPHSVTLYIDHNNDIRGYEFGDSVQLSDDIIEKMFQDRHLSTETQSEMIMRSIFNTFTTVIDARIPQAEQINYDVGRKLGQRFETLFKSKKYQDLFMELQRFWKKHGFGEIDEVVIDNEKTSFKVYECFECSHLPILGHPVCKLDEGFLTALLETKLGTQYVVQEIDCVATGKPYCHFEVREFSPSPLPRKVA